MIEKVLDLNLVHIRGRLNLNGHLFRYFLIIDLFRKAIGHLFSYMKKKTIKLAWYFTNTGTYVR